MGTRKPGKSAAKETHAKRVYAVAAQKGRTKETIILGRDDFTQGAIRKFAAHPRVVKVVLEPDLAAIVAQASDTAPERLSDAGNAANARPNYLRIRQVANRLAEMDLHLSATAVTSSQAKDQWAMIAREAEQGVLTPIERRGGGTLVVVPAEKLAEMAARVPSKITYGDLLRNRPGVEANSVPRPRSSAGPVTRLRLPAGKPAVNSTTQSGRPR